MDNMQIGSITQLTNNRQINTPAQPPKDKELSMHLSLDMDSLDKQLEIARQKIIEVGELAEKKSVDLNLSLEFSIDGEVI